MSIVLILSPLTCFLKLSQSLKWLESDGSLSMLVVDRQAELRFDFRLEGGDEQSQWVAACRVELAIEVDGFCDLVASVVLVDWPARAIVSHLPALKRIQLKANAELVDSCLLLDT